MTTHHSTFTIERTYPQPPSRVFDAWADPAAKARWFHGPDGWHSAGHVLDFRVGGREHVATTGDNGEVHTYDAIYQDIVPNERIIYSYSMDQNDRRMSVSLATVELAPSGRGTTLRFTEQVVFVEHDGGYTAEEREHGTRFLLDNLGEEVAQ